MTSIQNSRIDGTIPAAHLNIRGATLLVVFPDATFDALPPGDRTKAYAALKSSAAKQGFQGEVAVLWEDPQGRTRFIAPPQQHPFFQLVNYGQLRAQVNGSITLTSPNQV